MYLGAEAGKAVGEDGFSVYALKQAPWAVRRACWGALRETVMEKEMPAAWKLNVGGSTIIFVVVASTDNVVVVVLSVSVSRA